MTLADVLPIAEQLAPEDRLALAERLWESIAGNPVDATEEARLVDQAYAAYLADPEAGLPWEQFECQLDAEFGPVS